MRISKIFYIILFVLIFCSERAAGQIPTKVFEITSILVDGCAGNLEGQNEMVMFQVGPNPVNVSNLRVDGAIGTGSITAGVWPNSANYWRGIAASPAKPVEVAAINNTIVNCGRLIEPTGGILPAGKKVLMITSTDFDYTAHSFASLSDTLYVIFQNAGNTAGHFVNFGSSATRTMVLVHLSTGIADTITYDRSLLTMQNGSPGAQDGGSVAFTWPGVASYYNNGCQAPYIPPSAAWTAPAAMCQNAGSLNLNSLVTGSPGGTWSGTGVTGSTFNPSGLSGNISITYTVGSAPCIFDSTQTITVNVSPTVSVSATASSICTGGSSTLTASGATSYAWSTGASTTSITVFPTSTTTYTVTGDNGTSCNGTATITIAVSTNATIAATASPASVCAGGSTTISATGGTTYSWSPSGTGSSFSVTPATTTTYSVTGSSGAGCTGTASVLVTVNSYPTVSASASPATVCAGQTSALSASGASTYVWSSGSATVSPAATTTYTVTGTSAAGCTGTASVTVSVNPVPAISASASSTSICSGASTTISASGGTTYLWSPSGSGSSFSATPALTTTYNVTGTDALGCSGTATVSVTVNPLPSITATASPATICIGFSTTISATGCSSYSWDSGQTIDSFTDSPITSTTYSVTGSDANNCSNTATVTVTVITDLPVSITPSTISICEGASTTLTVSSTGSGVGYLWDTGANTDALTVSPVAMTTYSVTGTDVLGCSGTATAVVNVNPAPVAMFDAGPLTGCNPTLVNFTDQSPGNIQSWSWDFGDGTTSGVQNPDHTYDAGTFSVSLTVTDAVGCQAILSMNNYITILDNPVALFRADPEVASENDPFIQFINQSSGALVYAWNFGDGVGVSQAEHPAYTYGGNGQYLVTLLVANAAGCTDSTALTVSIRPMYTIYIPTAISPNGDGINDVFSPKGTGWNTDSYFMAIFSRWGQMVFKTTDINHGWNGFMPDGTKEAPEDVYTVIIHIKGFDGNEREYIQQVTVIK
ncbi:MAG: hypothetical protein A2W93_02630 [Bacteroidetes bacterium GWF2_43_63]|nr:MAG: hypothetical protein A2W94_08640 [Bacteroidetes bacterium GWE2_42_42]OFY53565.1 MAG: hypothetical protein A2W93_02630 [Bacteroidetes bacterium GWF2_43_63]HBG71104.1 hypothetical protein [Bacteroidales bacterium]HCB63681.1 hypothetical protein [Bacteroidales bacterium]HCY24430.1 hypothetical protein [Bacteroidales bacterium]